jgi:hypothetical protein
MTTAQRFPAAIVVLASHFITGLLIVLGLGEGALHTTPMSLISTICNYNVEAVGLILIATALFAALPFAMVVSRETFVFCIAPQQILLVLHCTSAVMAISSGHYPDGYVPAGGTYFILIDQIWLLLISIWHTAEYAQS